MPVILTRVMLVILVQPCILLLAIVTSSCAKNREAKREDHAPAHHSRSRHLAAARQINASAAPGLLEALPALLR